MKPKHVFADDVGNIYVVAFDGDLLWYKDLNRNGAPGWAARSGNKIGSGWQEMRHVFCGGDGIIYAVNFSGDLFWYKDENRNGTQGWAAGHPVIVSAMDGKEVRLALSGGDGIIYAIKDNGDLLFFHDVNRNGSPGWATGSGNRIGNGWQAMRLVCGDTNGSIYAVQDNGDLRWYKDLARNGTVGWAAGSSNVIGNGWNGCPYRILRRGWHPLRRPGPTAIYFSFAMQTAMARSVWPPVPATGLVTAGTTHVCAAAERIGRWIVHRQQSAGTRNTAPAGSACGI